MQVKYFLPSPEINFFIKCYVYYNINTYDQLCFLPNGHPGLTINFTGEYKVYNEKHQGECFKSHYFIGNAKNSYSVLPNGKFSGLGVYFEPTILFQLLNLSLNKITDTILPVSDLEDNEYRFLVEKIISAKNIKESIVIINDFFLKRLRKLNICYTDVDFAIEYIKRHNGNISICDLANKFNMSVRTLERKFLQYIGLTPKQYTKVIRINRILNNLKQGSLRKLSDIAYQFGYFDQMHFIKDFKNFTGKCPTEFNLESLPFSNKSKNLLYS